MKKISVFAISDDSEENDHEVIFEGDEFLDEAGKIKPEIREKIGEIFPGAEWTNSGVIVNREPGWGELGQLQGIAERMGAEFEKSTRSEASFRDVYRAPKR